MQHINDSDIAIIGMAIRVPDAATPEAFWNNLHAGVESVRTYTEEELLAKGVTPGQLADPHYVRAGIPLQGVDQFDPEFFGFSPKEAAILDPQHRQFYEVSWEALERAGHPPEAFDGAIGVFAGCGMGAYFTFNLLSNADLVDSVGLFLLRHTGNDKDFLATRVSYSFNLRGPSVNVQTACSTSLVATHLAVQSLLSGECDMALAGGATIELPHGVGYVYKEGEVLSPDGHCRTFDHRSRGTVFGSGAGVVVLRRLADAIRDGDHVHAVIKGSAVNNDGSGKVGYLAPSVDGQAGAVAEALAVADVPAESVTYIECHGTATPVGDPIEIAALTRAFRESTERVGFCRVGSVKTNIGHLDTAAGVASLIKATMALEHRKIPPSLNFEAPNPAIDFASSPFSVAASLIDWESDNGPRRAGINSLGVGGTNAFVILEEAPPRPASPEDASPQLLVLSARSRRALDDAGQRLAEWLKANPQQRLSDVAYTLQFGRHGFDQRRVLACANHAEAISLLEGNDARRVFTHTSELERPSLVFMYPGGGPQYYRMGLGLYERESVFREHVDHGLSVLQTRFGVDLSPIFFADKLSREHIAEQLSRPATQLPLTFIIEYALTRLWESLGVQPDALIGHSMGENVAAAVAGVYSFEDALGLLLLRGQLVEKAPPGGLLSVPMSAADLRELAGDELDIATSNGPQLSVVSGSHEALERFAAKLTALKIEFQRVRVSVAAHSRLLDGILDEFRTYLTGIELHPPSVDIVSNRSGTWLTPEEACDPEYWVGHLRHTVLYADGVETLLESSERVFLEVGPGNMLGSFVRQNPKAPAQRVLSSMRHPDDPVDDQVYLRTVIGRLWAVGIPVDLGKLHLHARQRVPLPTYPFQHARYWIEPGKAQTSERTAPIRPAAESNLDDWFWQAKWVQHGIVESAEPCAKWLVFHTNEPVTQALIRQLRETGRTVVTVQAGDTFARIDEHAYTLAPEAGGAGYQELLDELAAHDLLPERILHAWLLTYDRSFRPGSSFLHRNQEYGFYSLFHLARALGKSFPADTPVHLLVVGNGVQQVDSEPLPYPDKATVLGPCAVIPREFPNISCSFVDVQLEQASRKRLGRESARRSDVSLGAVQAIALELDAPASNTVVAWRDSVRWRRFLGRLGVSEAHAHAGRLKKQGVYLLTGGFGGIASEVAQWLARSYQARLVLVGRTPLPAPDEWDSWLAQHDGADSIARAIRQVRQLQALGAQVLPLAADVTVAEQMQDVVDSANSAFGRIDGVFHTAGLIRDNLIQLKSQRDIEDVFAAKLYGTMVLDELFRKSSLDFMLLFSSTSAYIAPQGQVDYVGASAYLNAFAQSCRAHRPYPVSAINWGIWRDVGMVASPPSASDPQSLDSEMQRASRHSTAHPLLHSRFSSRDGTAQLHIFAGNLSTADHWVVDDHRLGTGEALLPGTGYLELIRAGLAELGETAPWQLRNLVFQSPLFVDDGEKQEFCLRLHGGQQHWDVKLFGHAASRSEGEHWQLCASARVDCESPARAAPLQRSILEASCNDHVSSAAGSARLRTRQEDHLKFGPRWRVLRQLRLGAGQALAHLQLPDDCLDDLKDYPLHPALLDIATGCAMDLIRGYAEQEVASHLWIPIAYQGFCFHAPLEGELLSWIRACDDASAKSEFATFDIVIANASGESLVEVEALTLRRTEGRLQRPGSRNEEAAIAADGSPTRAREKSRSPAEEALRHNISQGISTKPGLEALLRLLNSDLPSVPVVSSMRLPALIQQAESLSSTAPQIDETRFARPELDSDFAPPRDDIEKGLADLWGRLLGVEGVGIHDSFFELGGHSLIAVRLFNELSDKYDIELPMSVLLQSPDIARLGELIRGEPFGAGGEEGDAARQSHERKQSQVARFTHVVPMHSGPVAGGTPLFLVAGMFGNVLNLSHLAHLLGEDRPFYALQARGLYGNDEPHERFEDMARDYIAEVRQVQASGPYLLGGFSGGGLIAYEMARQLLEEGDEVLTVIMLDTPVRDMPNFGLIDRATIFLQGLKAGGLSFFAEKVRERVAWEKEKRALAQTQNSADDVGLSFQSRKIGDAFVRALVRYDVPKVPVDIAVFRPKLDIRYRLSGGRLVDSKRNFVAADNGWTPFVRNVRILEVPGNHDSMVLEPNVRVMVSLLRRTIEAAERHDRNGDR